MTKEKILSVVDLYQDRFEKEKILKERIDLEKMIDLSDPNIRLRLLAHAHYLLDGIKQFVENPKQLGKTGRHLGSVQTLLLVCGWYSLAEKMKHNWPDVQA